jgi:hypothetical protein
MKDEQLRVALDFISVHRMAVIATCTTDRAPECALVSYAARGDHLIVGTDSASRKYRNLTANARVAVVIGLDAPVTLQYEGVATELHGAAAVEHAALLLERHPETALFVAGPTARTFLIAPRWMRYTDYSTLPPDIFELRF